MQRILSDAWLVLRHIFSDVGVLCFCIVLVVLLALERFDKKQKLFSKRIAGMPLALWLALGIAFLVVVGRSIF
jgi:hypothetical protein